MSYLSYDQLCHKRQNPFCSLGTNWMLNWRLSDANTHTKETHFSIHFLLVIQRGWVHPASCNIPLFSAVFSSSFKKQLWKQMFRYQTGSGITYIRLILNQIFKNEPWVIACQTVTSQPWDKSDCCAIPRVSCCWRAEQTNIHSAYATRTVLVLTPTAGWIIRFVLLYIYILYFSPSTLPSS